MPLASAIDLPARYRVVRHIASGGMASVWEAEDQLLGRVVAVKVLAGRYAADRGARERFQREARTAAQVSSKTNIVTIYDIGEHGDDAFIVMEHFSGGTVADRLRAARDAGERVPRETALGWLREAAAGLDVAHAAGIVHRDVKPANLLLDARGRLAVGDFGIARLADDTQMTQTGQVLGTAAYISPEQARGRAATAASDRYALAIVAYELLTGVRPFAGGPATAQALQHAQTLPPLASEVAPDLPPAIDAALARGLAKDPAARPRSSSQLVDALERALGEPAAGGGAGARAPIVHTLARPAPAPPIEPMPAERATRVRPSLPPLAGTSPHSRGSRLRRGLPPAGPAASSPPAGPAELSPDDASAPHARRLRPLTAIVGAAALLVAAVAVAVALPSGGGPQPGAKARTTGHDKQPARKSSSAPKTAAAGSKPAAPPKTTSQSASPADLNDRGYALLQQGRYAEAIEPLQAAVDAYRASGSKGLPYAYALFNLAVALNRSGNPGAAIPLLRERLTFDDQRSTVKAELADALAKVGGQGPAAAQAPGTQAPGAAQVPGAKQQPGGKQAPSGGGQGSAAGKRPGKQRVGHGANRDGK